MDKIIFVILNSTSQGSQVSYTQKGSICSSSISSSNSNSSSSSSTIYSCII